MSDHASHTFADVNAGKANFTDVYRRPDPRAYYTVLGALDYVIPEVASPIFSQLAEQCAAELRRPITVLDIGCSYGVNAALLRHGVTLRQLRERYISPSIQALPSDRVAEYDGRYFSGWPARKDIQFVGIDTSPEAIRYARETSLLNDGAAINLEEAPLSDRLRALIGRADLVISTGCVGYITHKTFNKIMEASVGREHKPWIASFVLRMFDYMKIGHSLARHGLVTEKLDGATFVQRRFRDPAEQEQSIAALDTLGIDSAGKESEGLLHAELFVSRPELSAATHRLTDIVSLSSGIARARGDRHRLVSGQSDHATA